MTYALVIGSSLIDLFLKIENEKENTTISDSTVTLRLGAKIPIDINRLAIGGNGANVSVGLTRLGVKTTFFTYLGEDIFSRQISETIKDEGVNLIIEKGKSQKSSLSLIFDIDRDRIIFSHHERRDHTFYYEHASLPTFCYLTSMGRDWDKAYQQFLLFATHNNIPFAFAPGSHQMMDKNTLFEDACRKASIIFINKEEAQSIIEHFTKKQIEDIKELLVQLKNLGPTEVSITAGEKGAFFIGKNGTMSHIEPYRGHEQRVEKTGAGDAYASGFLAAYLHEKKVDECMRWGVINAYYSMQEIGAQAGLVKQYEMLEALKNTSALKVEQL